VKVLLSSNTPWGTSGYSTQSRLLLKILKWMGHEVAVYAWYGMEGQRLQIDGFDVYPRIQHRYGGDAGLIAKDWGADVVLTLQDIWPLPDDFGDSVREAGAKWAAYFPIDGVPMPPAVERQARQADYRIVYSRFACCVMDETGLDYQYAPHAVDTELFSPAADRAALRAEMNIPQNAYMVLMVAANKGYPSRKSYPEAFAAFRSFQRRRPEAVLFVHAKQDEAIGAGLKLGQLAYQLGIPAGALRFIDQEQFALGLPSSLVADLYRTADVLLMPSMGEGFGLPIVEAQACGLPVITQDCTSMSELTCNGVACPPLQKFYTALSHWQFIADVEAVEGALEWIYRRTPQETAEAAALGRQFVVDNYSLEHVANHFWYPVLKHIEETL